MASKAPVSVDSLNAHIGGLLGGAKTLGPAGAVGPKKVAPAKPAARGLTLKQALSPDNLGAGGKHVATVSGAQQAGLNALGLGRVVLRSAEGISKAVYNHPFQQAGKTVSGIANTAKGVASAAIALPVYTAEYPVKEALKAAGIGHGATNPLHFVKRIAAGETKSLSQKYGGVYRGEKGAGAKLDKQIAQEGPVPTALDLATASPLAEATLGKVAQLARVAKGGEAAAEAARGLAPAALRARPALKVNPLKPGVVQRERGSVSGAAITKAHDVIVRGTAQKVATARAAKPEGAILHKPLSARRAALAPGEIAPASQRAANYTLRARTALLHTRGKATAAFNTHQYVTGRDVEGSLAHTMRSVGTPEEQAAIQYAAANGIRDAKGFAVVAAKREAEIKAGREAAAKTPGVAQTRLEAKAGKVEARAGHDASTADELKQIAEWRKDPSVFDRHEIKAGADALQHLKEVEAGLVGIHPDRAALGRAAPLGKTLGVKTADELNAENLATHGEHLGRVRAAVREEHAANAKATKVAERAHIEARKQRARVGAEALAERQAATSAGGAAARAEERGATHAGGFATERERVAAASAATDAKAALVKAEARHATAREAVAAKRPGAEARLGKAYDDLQAARAENRVATQRSLKAAGAGRREHVAVSNTEGRQAAIRPVAGTAGRRAGSSAARLEAAQAEAEANAGQLKAVRAVQSGARAGHREALNAARIKPERITETGTEYEKRVIAAAAEHGLVAPTHIKSGFESKIASVRSEFAQPANPLSKTRTGVLRATGREELTHRIAEKDMAAKLRKAATLDAKRQILEEHGLLYPTREAAAEAIRAHNVDPSEEGLLAAGLALHGGTEAGQVYVLPHAVKDELDRLGATPSKVAANLRHLSTFPQAVLLAGSISWFEFQRTNDLIASALGGSLHRTAELNRQIKALAPSERVITHTFSGDSIGAIHLQPDSVRELGRMQEIIDSNKVLSVAFKHGNPASTLLRVDQKITGGFRERQFIHNLHVVARDMDPHVAFINRAYSPLGFAMKTGDIELTRKLLTDPAAAAIREEAASRLYKIHGDWHSFTAGEQKLKVFAAFYGFLRYATRMAFFTLPVDHPYVGLLIGQLGQAGYKDAKSIIGTNIPYGLGALYNDDGTVAMDLSRANPVMSPLFQIQKPEQLAGLLTPIAGLLLDFIAQQPVAQGDASQGYQAKYSARGDLKNNTLRGSDRGRIALNEGLSLFAPYRDWRKFDPRQQTSDSLPFSRQIALGSNVKEQLKIDKTNAATAGAGGLSGLVHTELPLLAGGSAQNVKALGQRIGSAQAAAAKLRAAHQTARDYNLSDPLGKQLYQSDLSTARKLAPIQAHIDAALAPANAKLAAIQARIDAALAKKP